MLSLEIEDNSNCQGMPLMVFPSVGIPKAVSIIKFQRPGGVLKPHYVTGWSSAEGGSPTPARYVRVEDSGAGFSYLVYGGDWGLRFKPVDTEEPWDLASPHQWGEPFIILVDIADILDPN